MEKERIRPGKDRRPAPGGPAFRFLWSEADGIRTAVSHVLYAHRPLSLALVQQLQRSRRPPAQAGPALRDLRRAAQRLTDAGQATFSGADLLQQLDRDGCTWSPDWIRELLRQECSWRHDAELVRVVPRRFALRKCDGGTPTTRSVFLTADMYVVMSLRELLSSPESTATSAQVHTYLRCRGVDYSVDSVRRALSLLARQPDSAVTTRGRGRYCLR